MNTFNKRWILASVLFALIISFAAGVNLGKNSIDPIEKITSLVNKESSVVFESAETDFSPFWKAWSIINEKYNEGSSTTTDQEKIWGAIEGLVASLDDPHSVFFPPQESKVFEENIKGNFGGVGIEIGIRDDILTVISPLKGTPAERAGILAGDKIIAVDATSTINMRIEDAVNVIRGEIGTPVILTIAREGESEPLDIEVLRDTITIPTIETELREDNIFVIQLYNFSAPSPQLFRNALREFVLSGTDRLILDLRGNPGGFLEAAVDISSWFLPAGKTIVTEDYGGTRNDIVHRSKGYDIFNENLQLVVLIDRGSASASEILAGALREHDIATLVGEKTFGKGSVQELDKITSETSVKLTVAHWKTPNGNSISEGGLTPDFEVEITKEQREAGEDSQLNKAIELLLAQ